MNVRVMRMFVNQRLMPMPVAMRLAAIPAEIVVVLVMRIVPMGVCMLHGLVGVLVLVMFPKVKPDAKCHQCPCNPEQDAGRFRPQDK